MRGEIQKIRSLVKTVEALLETGEKKAKLDPVHDQYLKIHWKGRKEKFAKEHKAELDEWNQADRFIRKHMKDVPFNAGKLQSNLVSLNAKLDEPNASLKLYQEETQMLKDIRYLVKDLLPELEPEGEKMTPESKDWRQMTVRERLVAASKEFAAENETRQQPQRK
jgi:mobA/mobL family protein